MRADRPAPSSSADSHWMRSHSRTGAGWCGKRSRISTTSSMVMMPTSLSSLSTTGMAVNSYFLNILARTLVGTVGLRYLLLSDPDAVIGEMMHKSVVSLHTLMDQEEVARMFKKYEFTAMRVTARVHQHGDKSRQHHIPAQRTFERSDDAARKRGRYHQQQKPWDPFLKKA